MTTTRRVWHQRLRLRRQKAKQHQEQGALGSSQRSVPPEAMRNVLFAKRPHHLLLEPPPHELGQLWQKTRMRRTKPRSKEGMMMMTIKSQCLQEVEALANRRMWFWTVMTKPRLPMTKPVARMKRMIFWFPRLVPAPRAKHTPKGTPFFLVVIRNIVLGQIGIGDANW